MEDADEENNADTSSVTLTQLGESWARSQALGIDAEETDVNYRSCGASYGAQDLSNAQDRFNSSNARVEETVNVDNYGVNAQETSASCTAARQAF